MLLWVVFYHHLTCCMLLLFGLILRYIVNFLQEASSSGSLASPSYTIHHPINIIQSMLLRRRRLHESIVSLWVLLS